MRDTTILRTVCLALLLALLSIPGHADPVERRRDQFGKEFGYYAYPLVVEVPGMGKGGGAGFSVLNMAESDTDLTGFYLRGDLSATGLAVLDHHIIPKRLVVDAGYYDFLVAPLVYDRGITSDAKNVIHPKVAGMYMLGQMTLTFDERRYEGYVRMLGGRQRMLSVLDSNGQAFPNIDNSWMEARLTTVGGSLDLTDDRLDPRKGVRLELASQLPVNTGADRSEYFASNVNLTGYLPSRKSDTLVFNVFYSRANVTREGLTDYATLQQRYGLGCANYPAGPAQTDCLAAEAKLLNGWIANNRYGTATPLGGTQRLRSFDNGRFYAGQALSYGVEYRWNLTDEYTPFDIRIAKGIRTNIQVAAFAERGMVADNSSDLLKDGRNSFGVGFRVVLSGAVLRLDLATGDEGVRSQLFISYPWSMFSVDKPG